MRRKIVSILMIGLMALTGWGCGSENSVDSTETIDVQKIIQDANTDISEDGKTIINIYAQYADDDTKVPYDYAVEQLKEKYPDVELNLIIQSQDDGATIKLLAQTGQLPDIFQANTSVIGTLKESGNIMQLDSVAESTGYTSKLYESCKELAYDSDGHIYCFPYAGNEYVLWYYNKALFDQCNLKVPTTYDELMNCVKVFKAHGIIPVSTWSEGWITSAVYDVFATNYVSSGIYGLDTGATSISDEGYLKAAEDLKTFVDAGMFNSDAASCDYDRASSLFIKGKAAMFLSGQWFITDAEKQMGDKVDWMYYPAKDAATYETAKFAFSGGGSTSGYSVNPNSKNAELAAEIAEFMAEKYCEAKVMYRGNPLVALETGKEPSLQTKSEDGDDVIVSDLPAMMQKLSSAIPSMTSTTKFTWGLSNSTFSDSLMEATNAMLAGKVSGSEMISQIKQ